MQVPNPPVYTVIISEEQVQKPFAASEVKIIKAGHLGDFSKILNILEYLV